MFTLKVSTDAPAQSTPLRSPQVEMWFPGVRSVSNLGRFPFERLDDIVRLYQPSIYLGYVSKAEGSDEVTTISGEFALLWVCFDDRIDSERYMLVEKAWLLGPSGGTVDRIAP